MGLLLTAAFTGQSRISVLSADIEDQSKLSIWFPNKNDSTYRVECFFKEKLVYVL